MLIVDLDGVLTKTSIAQEALFARLAAGPISVLRALAALGRDRSAFRTNLLRDAGVDVAQLPYRPEVLAHIENYRRSGGRTVLLAATDPKLAEAMAAHLDCFDEVCFIGQDAAADSGQRKAFVQQRFGAEKVEFMDADAATHAGWPETPEGFARAKPYLKAVRPHQWLKNVLVFLPPIAAHALSIDIWLAALVAFIAFSLAASSAYVLNDLLDLAADRAHPRKRNRPFASGAIPLMHGLIMVPGLLLAALLLVVIAAPLAFAGILIVYYAVTLTYSLVLKRMLLIDICTLAGLYTVRVIGGALATGLALSIWMLAFSMFLFFSLAAMKRQTELVDGLNTGRSKAVGRAYEVEDLPIIAMMAIASGYLAVLVLALYIDTPAVTQLYESPYILWGVCLILLFWVSRFVVIAHRGQMDDDPVIYAVRDKVSLSCGALIGAIVLAASLL